jgi:hypothetical protein
MAKRCIREAMRQHPAWPEFKTLGVWWGVLALGGGVTLLVYRSGGPKLLLVLGAIGCIYATIRVRKALRAFRQKVIAARSLV